MATRPRPVSNNVGACLGDIIALTLEVRPQLVAAGEVAQKRYQDPVLLADLVVIERAVNDIERHARNAQQNRYEPRRR